MRKSTSITIGLGTLGPLLIGSVIVGAGTNVQAAPQRAPAPAPTPTPAPTSPLPPPPCMTGHLRATGGTPGATRYVRAQINTNLLLRAIDNTRNPWTRYRFCKIPGGKWYIVAANGRYVTADYSLAGPAKGSLRASAYFVGPWQQFWLTTIAGDYRIRSAAPAFSYPWVRTEVGTNRLRATPGIGPFSAGMYGIVP